MSRALFVFKKLFPGGGSTTPIRSVTIPLSGDGDGPLLTNLFDNWCKDRGKKYVSEEEKQRRLKVFERNYASLSPLNMSNSIYMASLMLMTKVPFAQIFSTKRNSLLNR
ncbi:cathepsin L [Salvia divinorum]|uniref:Cathepsin L n=1 Tax=Salvia divinorum TaxID=28513 RepID=A0ABD1H4M9_SALDI